MPGGFWYNQTAGGKPIINIRSMSMETNNITLNAQGENVGTIQIADDVVAMIAALAAAEVEGVKAMAGTLSNEMMSKVSTKKLTRGVRVAIEDHEVTIKIAITLEFGFNIPETCRQVQEKVKSAVETMTGLSVSNVNIKIVSVNMPKSR